MSQKAKIETWYVRRDGDQGDGCAIRWLSLVQGIEDRVWGEIDQVRTEGDTGWQLIGDSLLLSGYLPVQKISSKTNVDDEVDMTAMIDVVFQLIIFFMVASALTVHSTLDMPKQAKQKEEGAGRKMTMETLEETMIVVKITKDGHFVIDGENTEKDGLLNMLQIQLEKEKNKQSKAMAIDADDEARHEDVVSVIDAAAAAKVQNITFVAHKKFGEKAP